MKYKSNILLDLIQKIKAFIEFGRSFDGDMIIISSEVGMGCRSLENYIDNYFQSICGQMNNYVAKHSDRAYAVISVVEVKQK